MEIIKVLIVEDREEHQKLFKRIVVGKLGYECMIASSLDESLMLLKAQKFHIVLTDLSLSPDNDRNRDGIKVLAFIKESNLKVKSLVLTAYGDVVDADKCFSTYNISGFIPKIADVETIILRIKNVAEMALKEQDS